MSADLVGLPLELYVNRIIPGLGIDARALCAFSRTSKTALAIIFHCARYTECDIHHVSTRSAANVETPVYECIFQILKEQICKYPRVESHSLIHLTLPYVFHSKKVIFGRKLGEVFCKVVNYWSNYPELAELVLVQADAKNIPGTSDALTINLGQVLKDAICANNPKLVRMILSFPNAKTIAPLTLNQALDCALAAKNPKLVFKVVSHPNAIHMQLLADTCLSCVKDTLYVAVRNNNPNLITAVLHHPKIIDLPEIDLCKAGRAMLIEQDRTSLLQLQQMLQEPLELKELRKAFRTLSVGTRYFFFLMLCKTHGRPQGNIETDGPYHLVKQPRSLLPIIDNLLTM